ncbi:MAG TPA: hypothetical protein VMW36_11400 [Patescibacteria group bacterium]|nr:hypothetical protein [Patescibacteria group bacterium]
MGYPIPGQSWSIYVYNVSRVGGVDTFKPLPNASVLVTLKTSENVRNYTISTNENGQVSFPFLPEYADVAFRASASGTSSASIVISMHYVSSGILDLMSIVEFPLAIVGFITSVQAFRVRKLGRIVRMLGIVTVTTFAITGFFSIYARFYQETLWGYPEVLIKLGAITMSVALLEYLFFFGLAMLSLLAVCTIYGSKRK